MLKIYQKPTNHVQTCPTCKEPLIKGNYVACDTFIERGFTRNEYFHIVCVLREINQMCVTTGVHGFQTNANPTLVDIVNSYADEVTKPL